MIEIKEYLAQLYDRLGTKVSEENQIQIVTLIIDIKRENPEISNSKNSLYLDVKKFISLYLRNKRLQDYGYEEYNYLLIRDYIMGSGFNSKQKLKLLVYTRYLLLSLSYEYGWVEPLIKKASLELSFRERKLSFILQISSWNSFTLLLSILFIYILECILLLPAPISCMSVCTLIPVHYSDCSISNHMLNVLSLHFSCISNSAKIEFNSLGIVFFALWNMLYAIVCVNFLFKNLFSKFEVYDKC